MEGGGILTHKQVGDGRSVTGPQNKWEMESCNL